MSDWFRGNVSLPTLNLIVLRAADIEKSRSFYEAIGFAFVPEQHGTGPIHYACELGALVIEIYPGKPGTAPDWKSAGATTIGFQVDDLDRVIERLQEDGASLLSAPKDSAWGRRAVVQDPDGRAVELTQPAAN